MKEDARLMRELQLMSRLINLSALLKDSNLGQLVYLFLVNIILRRMVINEISGILWQ